MCHVRTFVHILVYNIINDNVHLLGGNREVQRILVGLRTKFRQQVSDFTVDSTTRKAGDRVLLYRSVYASARCNF